MATRPSTSTRTFHLFPSLPPELRCQIWTYALPESFTNPPPEYTHYISIQVANANDSIGAVYRSKQRRLHPLFYVNRESRSEAARMDGGKWFAMEFRDLPPSEAVYGRTRVYPNANKERPYVYVNKNKEVVLVRQRGYSGNWQIRVLGQGDICCWLVQGWTDDQ
jgi:hypothetical protein